MANRVRIKDIAKKTGLSVGTIDRVIHNRGQVAQKTKEIISKAIEELDYKPNLIAQALAAKKKCKVSVLIPKPGKNNPFWELPVKGIKIAFEELKIYNIELIFNFFTINDEKSFKNEYEKILQSDASGVIIAPVFKDSALKFSLELDKKETPYVLINSRLDESNAQCYVGQNAVRSGAVAAKLIKLSLKEKSDVLILNISKRNDKYAHFVNRVEGFKSHVKEDAGLIDNLIELNLKDGVDIELKKALVEHENVKAIFVSSSKTYEVAKYLKTNKIDGISLVGYDLIDETIKYIENGSIDFIISQKPIFQGQESLKALFDVIFKKDKEKKDYFLPIEVITKENLDEYTQSYRDLLAKTI
jgi:LacI family transcriptional regulator